MANVVSLISTTLSSLSNLSCNPGFELDAGFMCYPQCKAGYSPTSFMCWSTCNRAIDTNESQANGTRLKDTGDDWHDDGALCRKRLYDRGVGYIPDACSDSNKQMFVGMCYTKCNSGKVATTWSPCTCSQPCPNNTVEGGFANCTKVNSYGRGGGNWGDGCPGGFTNMLLFCMNWSNFHFSGYQCPGGDFDPKTSPSGQCHFAPRSGRAAYGIKNGCPGVSMEVGAARDVNGNINPNMPSGNIAITDGNGNQYSAYGCYPDPNNPGSWKTPRAGILDDPQYYQSAYYPKWHPASGCSIDLSGDHWTFGSYQGSTCNNLPNDPTANVAGINTGFPGGLYSNVPIPRPLDADGNAVDAKTNTVRVDRQNTRCEENWGTLCYPQCDIGYYGFGCCVCSPSCGALRDDGATCHREWYDRGVGTIPDGCRDDNKIYEELLCYTACKQDYVHFCTTCTRRGCPYDGIGETALVCSKKSYYRGPGSIAIPALAGKANSKINIGKLRDGLERIILNALVIAACLLAALFIFSTNVYLRTKRIKVKTKF